MCRVLVVLACVFGAVGAGRGADKPTANAAQKDIPLKDIDRVFVDVGTKKKLVMLAKVNDEIARVKKEIETTKADAGLRAPQKAEAIESLRQEVDQLEAARETIEKANYAIPQLPVDALAVGQAGFFVESANADTIPAIHIKRIVGKYHFVARIENTDTLLWIELPTDSRSVGDRLELSGTFAIMGMRTSDNQACFYLQPYTPPSKRAKK